MLAITSQRSSKFYLSITFSVLFCLVMALMTGGLHAQATSKVGEVIMILMSASLIYGAFYVVVRFYRNAPKIAVDKESISFNNTVYYWRDLENVEMTGKRPFKFMGEQREGVLLKFTEQEEKYIFDDMYENTPQIKSFIQQVVIDRKPFENNKINSVAPIKLNEQDISYYKGRQLYCFDGITLWILLSPCLFIVVRSIILLEKGPLIGAGVFSIFLFAMFFWRFYYFGLTNDHLIIRLHNVPWFKKVYNLKNVQEIVFESKSKMPTCLRVITNDFESKLYPADTLWGKTWRKLKKDLEEKNIQVRNECVSEDDEPIRFKFFND